MRLYTRRLYSNAKTAVVRYHDFDVFGTQEGFRGQLDGVAELPAYAFVGHGRDDGQAAGEHSAIFYKKARLQLLARIDYIFVSRGSTVLDYGMLTDSLRGRYPSDHFPVVANVLLK